MRPYTWLGVLLGFALGLSVLALARGGGRQPPQSGPVLSECDGHVRELVIHYEPAARNIVEQTYHDFLTALEADVTVHVVCPSRQAFDELATIAGPHGCRLSPVLVRHPMTTWSRDRWLALLPARPGGPTTIWSPRAEAAQEVWPARAGDQRVGQDLALALGRSIVARRSDLYFDGGDVLADSEHAFVVPRVLDRNLQQTVADRDEFLHILGSELKRPVILLESAPDHHAGMFMVSIGHRTMLVADPSLAREFFPSAPEETNPAADPLGGSAGGPDFTPETQRLFDAVAVQCAVAGYHVVRVPTVPARDARTYLTYVNVLLDQQGGQRVVYLPFYRGAEALNDAARRVWEQQGYSIRPIDCTGTYRHFGCLHCLVNVLRRD